MSGQDPWLELARNLDWRFSYVSEQDAFPETISGRPWLPCDAWADWEEPYRSTYGSYVRTQADKESFVRTLREALGRSEDFDSLSPPWHSVLKLHGAALPLAEFAAVIGNLRAARFGRTSAWRSTALLGALDECRHTQIPLALYHELVKLDRQYDWTHRFYHSDNWVAIAARHLFDELLLASDPIEFAIGTHFVLETGFTNLQFIGLAMLARATGDRMSEKVLQSIQTDEARHAQIGAAVLRVVAAHDRRYAQWLLDKWFWRSWLLFAVLTGISMDYLTPLAQRTLSFREFMEEWILDHFLGMLGEYGLEKPWYWDLFLRSIESYHHMVYASAYTYRATVWFDMVVPGPEERAWLGAKYPETWPEIDPVWERISTLWRETDRGLDFGVHAFAIVTFCDLCQLVLSAGTPRRNTAVVVEHEGRKRIFCSEPCRWIFEQEPERYAKHKDVVKRVLEGAAPANVLELITRFFGLTYEDWGKDAFQGDYPWLDREGR